jgi:hypothetical protein
MKPSHKKGRLVSVDLSLRAARGDFAETSLAFAIGAITMPALFDGWIVQSGGCGILDALNFVTYGS